LTFFVKVSGMVKDMSNRKTPNFATQLFSNEKRDLICVKEEFQK